MGTREELIKQKEKTSLALIEAALEHCSKEGYASLSLRSVARKANIAPTSFYRHFRDIDELGVAMIDKGSDILLTWLVQTLDKMVWQPLKEYTLDERMTSIEKITIPFVDSFIHLMETHPFLLGLFFQERTGSSEPLRTSIAKTEKKMIDTLSDHLTTITLIHNSGFENTSLIAKTMIRIASADGLELLIQSNNNREEVIHQLIQKLNFLLLGASIQNQLKQGVKDA